ncbi:hypothetical protein GCM10027589_15870 [Actinocorallia lasiicapitis]
MIDVFVTEGTQEKAEPPGPWFGDGGSGGAAQATATARGAGRHGSDTLAEELAERRLLLEEGYVVLGGLLDEHGVHGVLPEEVVFPTPSISR